MATLFTPTHELFDDSGHSCGLYRQCGNSYSDAITWMLGGAPLRTSELLEWGWRAKQLSTLFRAHYTAVHGKDGSDCECEPADVNVNGLTLNQWAAAVGPIPRQGEAVSKDYPTENDVTLKDGSVWTHVNKDGLPCVVLAADHSAPMTSKQWVEYCRVMKTRARKAIDAARAARHEASKRAFANRTR